MLATLKGFELASQLEIYWVGVMEHRKDCELDAKWAKRLGE